MSQDKQPHSTHQADSIMLTLVLILAVLGLLILFSASEYNGRVRFHDSAYYFKKQLFASSRPWCHVSGFFHRLSLFRPSCTGRLPAFHALVHRRSALRTGDQRFKALAESRSTFFPAF